MKISVVGTGYVGLVAGACFADMGNIVTCVDNDHQKLEKLKKGIIPIFEPELEELIKANTKENRLFFTTNLDSAIKESQVCFIAVGTPQDKDGSADLSCVFNVAKEISKSINEYKVIVNKSTVPIGSTQKIKEIIQKNSNYDFDIVSNPEFLKQGSAVNDFLMPDRIIIGTDSQKAIKIMKEIYAPFSKNTNKIIIMDTKSAELTKYASNAFLATKISFMNNIANLCEKVGADIEMIKQGMSQDERIGNKFLSSGLGFGGSCFPKDIKALIKIGEENNISMDIIKATDEINQKQRQYFINKILNHFNNNIENKKIAVWGLAFKPKTNDMREAPSITIIQELLKKGAKITAFDPKAIDNAKRIFENKIEYAQNSLDALNDADCLLLLTEWNEFQNPDFEIIKKKMKQAIIFDGRNQYNYKELKQKGFTYYQIGKNTNEC